MADQTEGSIDIEAGPAAVMAVVADFGAYPEWSAEIKKVEVLERGGDGRATKVYFEVSAGPINATYTLAYTYRPDDAGVDWTLVEGSPIRNLEGSYELRPAVSRTNVTYRVRMDIGMPLPGFLRRQGERKIIDTALKGLKKRVESRTSP